MIRRPYIALGLVSLLPCMAAGVLWVMSDPPQVWWFGPDRADASTIIVVSQGYLEIHKRLGFFSDGYYSIELWQPIVAAFACWIIALLFVKPRRVGDVLPIMILAYLIAFALGTELMFPLVVDLDGVLLGLIIWRFVQPRPIPRGICAGCGYDLRATPDRCPECGRVPERRILSD